MTDSEFQPAMTGGCQCGAVRYALMSEPTHASICHCRMCQKAFGNYFSALTGVPRKDLIWTKGQPGNFRSSEAVERGFCRDCGTPLTYNALETDRITISIGSLDEPGRVKPEIQYGVEGRLPAFEKLHTLPGITTEDDNPPEMLMKMKSRQHPDHD
ncbi:GFA family protein [Microvirga sp. ACRRW]|uniref:GFA family protein n=1 Tax=Microvirga sp. ACRRW TaxID=2918205 RepID=UPI001EF6DB29|nr:GFA family protein [Microvirga sp. ACRRW]MCG7391434.1 GFA family protein [Microvirga sp. ACRRW]